MKLSPTLESRNSSSESKVAQGLLDDEAWQKMDEEILAGIEEAVKFAEESPFPEPEAALEDVFAE